MARRGKQTLITESEYKELVKNVRYANQAIKRLTERYGERSWATIGLYDKLEDSKVLALSKYGYIRVNRKMSDVKLKYIQKATEDFINAKTSTLRGAKRAIALTKEGIKEHFNSLETDDEGNLVNHELTDEQVGRLYNILENKDLRNQIEEFKPSETWARMIRAQEENLSYDEFANLFSEDANINDVDVKEYLKEIYKIYMK